MKTFFSHKVPSKHYRVVHFLTVITGTLSNQRVVHFGVDKHKYKAKLENCINKIKRSVENKREIKIVYSYIPSNNNGVSNITYGSPPTKKKSSVSKTILLIVSIIAIPILLTAFFQVKMSLVSLNFEPYNSFIGSVVASIVTVFIAYTQLKNK